MLPSSCSAKELGGVLGVAELVGRGLVDRRNDGARRGVGPPPGVEGHRLGPQTVGLSSCSPPRSLSLLIDRLRFDPVAQARVGRRARQRLICTLCPNCPEVETVRRGLASVMTGAVLATASRCNRPDLRFPFPENFAEPSDGTPRSRAVGRRAKYLLADLDDGQVLAMHLGMTGSFRVEAPGADGDACPAASIITSGEHRRSPRPCALRSRVRRHRHHLQRSAPFRLHDAGRAQRARRPSAIPGRRRRAVERGLRRRDAERA